MFSNVESQVWRTSEYPMFTLVIWPYFLPFFKTAERPRKSSLTIGTFFDAKVDFAQGGQIISANYL
jgi:hypothetical protein